MYGEYNFICSFGPVEFGYYEYPDGGCVDEYKVVARYWEKDSCYLDEKVLSYEDSPGEAVESISHYVENGMKCNGIKKSYAFPGGYTLQYQEGCKYIAVPIDYAMK